MQFSNEELLEPLKNYKDYRDRIEYIVGKIFSDGSSEYYELYDGVKALLDEKKQDYYFMKEAFYRELWNYEYCYSYNDFEVLEVFYNDIVYDRNADMETYFEQLNMSETERRAYRNAVEQYNDKVVA